MTMNRKNNFFLKAFANIGLALLLLTCMLPARADLELELTQGVDSAIPIALVPFSGDAQANANLVAVIGSDLQNSGRFRLVDASSAANMSNIDYDFWKAQKANNVVSGAITQQGGKYSVTLRLYDVYGRSVIINEEYKVANTELRRLAHHISDLIYEKLIGVRGVFSTKIAYVLVQHPNKKSSRYSLMVADADGYGPHALLVSSAPIMSPSWSPDGKKISYVSFEGNRAAIYLQEMATGKRQVISKFPGINGAPAWSPDGSKLALVLTKTGDPKIYILDLSSNQLQQVTSGASLDTEPSWSPDGKSLVFTSNRGGSPQIYKLDIASADIQRVTYQGSYNAKASFSADGQSIALLHQEDSLFTIAVQNLASGRVTPLTRSGFDESPSMAPNGSMIVYGTQVNDHAVLAEVSTDAKVKLTLPAAEGDVQSPAWSPFLN
jgi:TolB protein